MSKLLTITIFVLTSCNNSVMTDSGSLQADTTKLQQTLVDTTLMSKASLTKLSVLVLPPFDWIANEGISPDIQKVLETMFSNDMAFTLIKFPYRQLMNIPYQNVFDKKYCKPITDKIKTDVILMTKLIQTTRTGQMTSDRWNFQIKIFNTKTDKQFLSTITGIKLTSEEMENLLKSKREDLFAEIKNSR